MMNPAPQELCREAARALGLTRLVFAGPRVAVPWDRVERSVFGYMQRHRLPTEVTHRICDYASLGSCEELAIVDGGVCARVRYPYAYINTSRWEQLPAGLVVLVAVAHEQLGRKVPARVAGASVRALMGGHAEVVP